MNARLIPVATTLLAIVACSSTRQSPAPQRAPRVNADLITQEQMKAGGFRNAFDAVQSLRANWLIIRNTVPSTANAAPAPRAADSAGAPVIGRATSGEPTRGAPGMNAGIQVYLDGARIGGVEELKRIASVNIFSIRRLDATEAQTRFGVGHTNGAILVTTETTKP